MESTKVKMTLESVSPILFDRYSGINDSNDKEAQKNAIHKLYLNDVNEISIPSAVLKASIREAGREIGKKTECKKREMAIRAGLFFNQDMYSMAKKKADSVYGEIVARGKGSKVTRVVSYRPRVDNWKITCEATLFDLTPDFIKQATELAGFRHGLCGHRPEFGRFKLTSFEVLK